MKKSNFSKLICSLCLILCAPFLLFACSNSDPGDPPTADGGSGDGGSSGMEIGPDGSMTSPDGEEEIKVADFSDYFKGYTVLTNGDGTDYMVNTGSGEISFNTLLDRQFDVLADDLIFRLNYVYGDVRSGINDAGYATIGTHFHSLQYDGEDYKDADGNLAGVMINSLLTTDFTAASTLTSVNIDDIADYQKSMMIKHDNTDNVLSSMVALNFYGAIEGVNMKLSGGFISNSSSNLGVAWSVDPTTAKDAIKLKLAQIVSGSILTNYNDIIKSMNDLGLLEKHKEKIVDYILKNLIGETLVNNDNAYYEYYKQHHSGVINTTSIADARADISFNETYSPLLYKAYSVVIPAIVDQAFDNAFINTTVSIYPYFKRVNGSLGTFVTVGEDEDGNQELSTTGPIDLNTIILMPKNGALAHEVVVQVKTARKKDVNASIPSFVTIDNTDYFAHDIIVDIEINISYKRGDSLFNLSSVIPSQEEDSILSVDAKGDESSVPDPEDPLNSTVSMGNIPFAYSLALEDYFAALELGEMPPFQEYNGYDPTSDTNYLWNNYFKYDANGDMIYLDAGSDYLQISFNIVGVKQYSGDNNSNLVEYTGGGVVFDISVQPYNK